MKSSVLFACIIFTLLIFSCKKSSEKRACWQIVDFTGTHVTTICDKTEAELLDCVKNGTCGYGGAGFSSCNYFKVEGEKYCWKISNNYVNDITENEAKLIARCFSGGVTPVKIDCNVSCRKWFNREKRIYKPTGSVTYSFVTARVYCGDTLSTIYQGRQIIRKNDVDSLIVIQFRNDGTSW